MLQLQKRFVDARATRTRLEVFRAQRDSLSAELLRRAGVEEENRRLRALLGLASLGAGRFRAANLVPAGRAGEVVKLSFVVDIGAKEGVFPDAPVVSGEGLVGVVRVVTGDQATGDFWTQPEFRVSAMTADGRVFGIIRAVAGTPLLMRLDNTPFQTELPRGTELLTSGQGGVFPRGIPIGRVLELIEAEAGWARSYLVEPAVDPEAVREVMVLVDRGASGDLADIWLRPGSAEPR